MHNLSVPIIFQGECRIKIEHVLFPSFFFKITDPFDRRSFLMCSHDPLFGTNKNRILENGSCVFEVIILPNKKVVTLFFLLCLAISTYCWNCPKMHDAGTLTHPVPSMSQILTTFNLYPGGARIGLYVNSKQNDKQAIVKILRMWHPLARYVSRNGFCTINFFFGFKDGGTPWQDMLAEMASVRLTFFLGGGGGRGQGWWHL